MSKAAVVSVNSQDAGAELQDVVAGALATARKLGADAAIAKAFRTSGYDVTVRMGDVETIEHINGKGLSVSVYFGKSLGMSSSSDFANQAIDDTVRAACSIARHTSDDPCNGLADPDRLARDFPDLQLCNPWNIDREQAVDFAMQCEDTARGLDTRISNSNGASVSTTLKHSVLGSSDDFMVARKSTGHSIGCSVIAESESGMQSDYWATSARDPADLDNPELVGKMVAERVVRKLNPRRLKSCEVPVLFESRIAGSLLGHFIGAIHGASLYRKASFLLDRVGTKVFSEGIRIHEQPHLKKGASSYSCDNEGVATSPREIVENGILKGYVLDSYSARRLDLETTGNAGGVFNLTIDTGSRNFDEMLKLLHRGVLVTDIMGQGVNIVTGDYSRGISGFWVENGEIQFPVEELTVAGNLQEIYQSIVEVGNDVDWRRRTRTGSILVEKMAIGGE